MLTLFARHSLVDLRVKAEGDIEVEEGDGTRYLVRMTLRHDRADSLPLAADRAP